MDVLRIIIPCLVPALQYLPKLTQRVRSKIINTDHANLVKSLVFLKTCLIQKVVMISPYPQCPHVRLMLQLRKYSMGRL